MISVKPQERLATFPTVKTPTNLFSSEPFRKGLAQISPLAWEKSPFFERNNYALKMEW